MRLKIAWMVAFICTGVAAQEPHFEPPVEEGLPSQLLIEELGGNLPAAADDGVAPKPILQMALDLIKAYEGWSATAYDDPVGYCTIGYGHLIKKDRCASTDLGQFAGKMSREDGN